MAMYDSGKKMAIEIGNVKSYRGGKTWLDEMKNCVIIGTL
jgi:hypothetical protein